MCGCLFIIAAAISPRFGVFILWAFTDRMSIAFDHFWWGLIGFIFLPWTTVAYALCYAPRDGVTGFGWFIVGLAFVVDLSTHAGSAKTRNDRNRATAA
ncbi:MAG: hypothetical protein WEC34_12500 [Acidimicrobiia bacterium]